MIELADIRAIATPKEVAKYFLGMPSYERGGNLWYCSPLRNEEHPSFKVDDIGMYAFGPNESYDIFKFVQKAKHCTFKESVDVLASMFGVSSRDYEDKSLALWYKEQRRKQEDYRKEVHVFYLAVWDEVDAEYHENKECLGIFEGHFDDDAYKICLDRQASVWGMEEYLAQEIETFEDEEKLMQKAMKGDLPTWLMDRLRMRMMVSQTLNTEHMQKREY